MGMFDDVDESDFSGSSSTVATPEEGSGEANTTDNKPQRPALIPTQLRARYYKAKPKFDPKIPNTYGTAWQLDHAEYVDKNGKYQNNVYLAFAHQKAPMTGEAGARVFDWEGCIKFKCSEVDLAQMALVLDYKEASCALCHTATINGQEVKTWLNLVVAKYIDDAKVQELVSLYENGNPEKGIAPREKGINPFAVRVELSRGNNRFPLFLQMHEVIIAKNWTNEAMVRLMSRQLIGNNQF